MNRNFLALAGLLLCWGIPVGAVAGDYEACMAVLKNQYKGIHTNPVCLKAATGHPDIQYALGMSYGYAGETVKELELYQAAAKGGFVPAYLALGHTMRSAPHKNNAAAISWYTKYVEAGGKGRGYAALLLSELYAQQGAHGEAEKWLAVCKSSGYAGCIK